MPQRAETAETTEITSAGELRELLGPIVPRAVTKERTRLLDVDRAWLAACPMCLVATADASGNCDVSPKGDPAGFVRVLDDTTLAIPERPGNRRADGYLNVLSNPHVGLLFVVPGRPDTLRVNGRARLLRDAPYFDDMIVKGHRPVLALVVDIEQVFFHCSKSFMRSHVWDPATWHPDDVPSRAVLTTATQPTTESLAELERYYGPAYADKLYQG